MPPPPNQIEKIESCFTCRLRADRLFCDLPARALQAFDAIRCPSYYSAGAELFLKGQPPAGVFVLCNGRAKLSTRLGDGRRRIVRVAEPGEVLGVSAAVSGRPYEVTAETLAPCQVAFVRRADFLRFLTEDGEVCLRIARHLSNELRASYEQVRALALTPSVAEKLARLLLDWCGESGEQTELGTLLKLALTHEEIAQMIGASRETVTRQLSEFKHKEIIYVTGSTLLVRDLAALEAMARA